MFEQTVLAGENSSNRIGSTCAGLAAQMLLVLAAALAPMVWPDALPRAQTLVSLMAPGPPVSSERAAPAHQAAHVAAVRRFQMADNVLRLPAVTPAHAERLEEPLADLPGLPGGEFTSGKDGVPGGVLNALLGLRPPVQPRPMAKPTAAPSPASAPLIRLQGGDVRLARPLYRVEPRYPQIAIAARISGRVELEGIIGTDGRIRNLRPLSGNPLLVPAALDAVRQWVYEPTLLNGKPVEVIAPITVIFRLAQ